MSLWEYKHITSGPHGFATPALLESYLNQLGKDEWEIISYQTLSNNTLAFSGIARRTTLRDWTLESAAAAAAKVEADKLRAEFAAKFHGNTAASTPEAAAEKPASLVAETAAPEDGLRKLRNTDRDGDPDATEEGEDWDNWDNYDDDLPTLFEAVKPHLRKNQRGPGQAVGVGFLAKRWEQTEADLTGALVECGFVVPEAEDTPPAYLEFEGDLYWLNRNNRNELFLNTREKPRPVFRILPAKKLDPADPVNAVLAEEVAAEQAEKEKREAERLAREAEQAARRAEQEARRAAAQAAREAQIAAAAAAVAAAASSPPAASAPETEASLAPAPAAEPLAPAEEAATAPVAETPATLPVEPRTPSAENPSSTLLPPGEELLALIRPQMRRNRRGPGYSGSTTYLARAFKQPEADLVAALAALGLHVPATANEKPVFTEIGAYVYWLNKDSRGSVWINGREGHGPRKETDAPKTEGGELKAEDSGLQSENSAPPSAETAPAAETTPVAAAAEVSAGPVEPAPATEETLAAGPAPSPAPIPQQDAFPFEPEPVVTPSAAEPAAPAAAIAGVDIPADSTAQPASANPVMEESARMAEEAAPSEDAVEAPAEEADAASPVFSGDPASPLTAVRLLLNPNKRGSGVSGEINQLARALEKDAQDLLTVLTGLGLALPETEEDKPAFVEHGDEIFWLNKNAKDGSVWLNAKTSRAAAKKTAARPRKVVRKD